MSAYDDYVIINSLTATIRNHENTIAELEYNLKSCEERIAKLSIDKNKRIKELENELVKEEPTDRFINHIDCFAQSEQGDFEGFIKMKKWFLERTPKHELERFIEETIDIAEYIDTQVSSPKLEVFCKELELLKPSNTDRFAMGTPSVDHAGKEGKL